MMFVMALNCGEDLDGVLMIDIQILVFMCQHLLLRCFSPTPTGRWLSSDSQAQIRGMPFQFRNKSKIFGPSEFQRFSTVIQSQLKLLIS